MIIRSVCNFMTSGEKRATKAIIDEGRVERCEGNERRERS